MICGLFLRIQETIIAYDDYYLQKYEIVGNIGLATCQKFTIVMRMLALGIKTDAIDEYCKIGESTTLESLEHYCVVVRAIIVHDYLRQPTRHVISKRMTINEERGFPNMFGFIDSMHWRWRACHVVHQWSCQDKD